MRVAPEGWIVLAPMFLVLAALSVAGGWLLGWLAAPLWVVALLLVVWGLWFFRDPRRTTPPGDDLVISPADGKVIKIDRAEPPPELRGALPPGSGPMVRVAIFLNLLNVHVNRTPARGTIVKLAYVPGRFITASADKASDLNERSGAVLRDPSGRHLVFVQIAGLVARRIVNHLREGQQVVAGERFGLIRFGSRAEVYLPDGAELRVRVGDTTIAGESVLAVLSPTGSKA